MKKILINKDFVTGIYNWIKIYDENENLILEQNINPITGENFKTEDEIVNFFKENFPDEEYYFEVEMPDYIKTKITVYFVKPTYTIDSTESIESNIVEVIKRNESVKVIVDIQLDYEQQIRAPINEKYLVPYFNYYDNNCDGVVVLEVINGHGEKIITPGFSGVYDIRLKEIKKIRENNQLIPLQDLPDEIYGISRIIVEEI